MRDARLRAVLACILLLTATGAAPKKKAAKGMDPVNPTCPQRLDWTSYPQMQFTVKNLADKQVLLAEGAIDLQMSARLDRVLKANPGVGEIWLRSPGGVARVGNAAGLLIRKSYPGMVTRIPKGWACFSSCNFVFMGGSLRVVEPGGQFVVHMFTHVADREDVKDEIKQDLDGAVDMIGEIEQSTAQQASEDNDFLIRMGISRKLLTEVMYQQKAVAGSGPDRSTRRCLNAGELSRYGVVNQIEVKGDK